MGLLLSAIRHSYLQGRGSTVRDSSWLGGCIQFLAAMYALTGGISVLYVLTCCTTLHVSDFILRSGDRSSSRHSFTRASIASAAAYGLLTTTTGSNMIYLPQILDGV
jgi:hypothetical protein